MLNIVHNFKSSNFTVPAGAGSYDTALYLKPPEYVSGVTNIPAVDGVTVLVEAGVATAVVELWCLKAEGDPTNDSDYYFGRTIVTSGAAGAGGMGTVDCNWKGIQLRVKSGGTSGTLTISGIAFTREPRA